MGMGAATCKGHLRRWLRWYRVRSQKLPKSRALASKESMCRSTVAWTSAGHLVCLPYPYLLPATCAHVQCLVKPVSMSNFASKDLAGRLPVAGQAELRLLVSSPPFMLGDLGAKVLLGAFRRELQDWNGLCCRAVDPSSAAATSLTSSQELQEQGRPEKTLVQTLEAGSARSHAGF